MLNIVLYEPEIPSNTGNIGRTCAATGTRLHLIRPYGFVIDDKSLKRAGMDYWSLLEVFEYDDFESFTRENPNANIYISTTKAEKFYTEVQFKKDDFIMFGKESAGIPKDILRKYPENMIRIPMMRERRSLNLANSVAIALYEALRQQEFPYLS
ncbi:MAG: tRNA (uridine(34)/cytosine(34)/5-carboxymethylaminomethyluridine(34)-2'-O)-methyltransferase TrmL [Clostridiales bacterium]|nr:tRNA (uridine(34)/cytosine(34)/5-carboxymethylaminomethyluridine(34)-2'-O)-methyltransferase TrmL [Clostridiales bacterium]